MAKEYAEKGYLVKELWAIVDKRQGKALSSALAPGPGSIQGISSQRMGSDPEEEKYDSTDLDAFQGSFIGPISEAAALA